MASPPRPLSEEAREQLRRDGFYIARGLLPRAEILPVLAGIDALLCAKTPGLTPSPLEKVDVEIHEKIARLQRTDRAGLGKIYQAMRKLLPFWSLLGGTALTQAVRTLLGTEPVGVAFRGAGIRLDLPHEDRWRSQWHQEYHSQMSSLHGVVAWFSLVPVTHDMGPVHIAQGSHREGLLPVRCHDPMNQGKDYTQTFEIPDVPALLARYPQVSFETALGDVVFLDFMTLHESGWNRSDGRSRITCQVRYFDMSEPTSVKHDWVGGWQDGGDFTRLHPDKVLP